MLLLRAWLKWEHLEIMRVAIDGPMLLRHFLYLVDKLMENFIHMILDLPISWIWISEIFYSIPIMLRKKEMNWSDWLKKIFKKQIRIEVNVHLSSPSDIILCIVQSVGENVKVLLENYLSTLIRCFINIRSIFIYVGIYTDIRELTRTTTDQKLSILKLMIFIFIKTQMLRYISLMASQEIDSGKVM